MRPDPSPTVTVLQPGMRALLWVAGVLVLLAGVQLFVFSGRTATHFAWTVEPPLTAAFLGAAYWAAAAFEWSAARQRQWADARIAVPAVFTFTLLTLIATLLHLEKFHLGSSFGGATQFVTWAWIAIYTLVPLFMLVVWWRQQAAPGTDPPRTHPLPRWLRAIVGLQALVLFVVGVGLYLSPETSTGWWPWTLTPLTSRAVGAWALSLAVAAGQALWEDDARRVRPAALAYLAFAVLETVSVLRYPEVGRWTSVAGVAYLGFLASSAITGVTTLWLARRSPATDAGPARIHATQV